MCIFLLSFFIQHVFSFHSSLFTFHNIFSVLFHFIIIPWFVFLFHCFIDIVFIVRTFPSSSCTTYLYVSPRWPFCYPLSSIFASLKLSITGTFFLVRHLAHNTPSPPSWTPCSYSAHNRWMHCSTFPFLLRGFSVLLRVTVLKEEGRVLMCCWVLAKEVWRGWGKGVTGLLYNTFSVSRLHHLLK